jgi:hypothetical protein
VLVIILGSMIPGWFAWWVDGTMADFSLLVIAWPGLTLSRFGVSYAWIPAAVIILGAPALVWVSFRSRPWLAVGLGGLILPILYCYAAVWWVRHLPCPEPDQTPYDGALDKRMTFLQTYRQGYICGLTGRIRTYCFSPEEETTGFYAGSYQGLADYYRFWGRDMPDRQRRLLEISARRDGVTLSAEPVQANQPVEATQPRLDASHDQ